MAKKKRKAGKKKSGGRRVGRAGKSEMGQALGVAAGVVATRFVESFAKKQFTNLDPKIAAAIPAALGAVVALNPLNVKAFEDPIVKGAGMGLIGGGVTNLLVAMDVVAAPSTPMVLRRRIAGVPAKVPVVGQGATQFPYNNMPIVGGNPSNVPVVGQMRHTQNAARTSGRKISAM